jgi:sulfide dehydrogenase cytochrome subunit
MIDRKHVLSTLFGVWGLHVTGHAPAADLEGFVLGAACLTCHANGDAHVPSLTGRDARELARLLTAYRDGTREGTVMPRLARGYDDAQVAAIAAWLAAQASRP